MYDHLQFANVNQDRSTNYDELIDLSASKYNYSSELMDWSNVELTDNGTLIKGSKEHQITQPGFQMLCKQLRIPDPFAKHIPWDLLKHNIDTLASRSDDAFQLFFREDGTVVSVAKDDFVPIPNRRLIDSIRQHSPDVKRGVISDVNMEIDVVQPNFTDEQSFGDVEVSVGDIVESGLKFHNSVSGHNYTKALIFLWRLVCTNGMSMPAKTGMAKLRSRVGRDLDTSITAFLRQVRELSFDANSTVDQFKSLNRPLDTNEFATYWSGVNKIVKDDEFVDQQIFHVNEDTRKVNMANNRANKKHPDEHPLLPTSVNGYGMVNNLTDAAKQFDQSTRVKMEAFGGKIVSEQVAQA